MKIPCIYLVYFSLISLTGAAFLNSCESLKDDPAYAGTWQYKETITSDNLVYNTTRTLVLTRRTFEEIYVIERENPPVISAIFGMSGDIRTSHTSFIFTLKALGTCVKDEMDMCTEEVAFYGPGTSHFDENIQYYSTEVPCEIDADQFRLRLVRDLNNDQDTEDQGEDIEFERI
ncbi:MAG: hypothetical protein RBR81_12445 [Bacteroidales bacterium]|jgi:hypothetical protein|nr:hypothetical protein [Bacteroidales bacterium]